MSRELDDCERLGLADQLAILLLTHVAVWLVSLCLCTHAIAGQGITLEVPRDCSE